MMLTLVFRVFAALLAIFGALNILLRILSDKVLAFLPVEFHPISTLTEAIALFGVGAGIYLLAGHQAKKAHH